MSIDRASAADSAAITVVPAMSKAEVIDFARKHDVAVWDGRARIEKFWADDDTSRATPYEVVETDPNILTTNGVTNLWNLAAAIGSPVAWSNANAYIAVGSGTGAAAAGNTALTTESNRQPMVTGYPSVSSNTITYQSSFGTSVANVTWTELGVINASSSGTLLNRLFIASPGWGTKTNSATWVCTMTVSPQLI